MNLQITLRKGRVVVSIYWEVNGQPCQVAFLSDLSQQGFVLLSLNRREVIKNEWKSERRKEKEDTFERIFIFLQNATCATHHLCYFQKFAKQ